MLDDDTLTGLFRRTRTIAVVGLSPRPERPSHDVARALRQWGVRIVPVNPAAGVAEILGERVWPDLAAAAAACARQGLRIDMVDVFRDASAVPPIVDDAIAIGADALWLQIGVVHEAAAARARAAGLVVEMDRCLKVEWRRLMPVR